MKIGSFIVINDFSHVQEGVFFSVEMSLSRVCVKWSRVFLQWSRVKLLISRDSTAYLAAYFSVFIVPAKTHTEWYTTAHKLSSSTCLYKYLHPFFVLHIGSALAISPYKMCLSPIKWGISPKIINTRDSCYIRATPKCSHFLYSRYNPSQKGETAC